MSSQATATTVSRCAIVTSRLTPSLAFFYQRLSEEIPDLELHTVLTMGQGTLPWKHVKAHSEVVRYETVERSGDRASLRRQVSALFRTLRYVSLCGIDVVVVSGYNDLLRLGLIWLLPYRAVAVMLYADSNDLLETRKSLWRRIAKRVLLSSIQGRLDAILTMGPSGKAYFERYMSSPPEIFAVPLIVDEGIFGGRSRYDYREACSEFSLDPTRRRILYVGRLVRAKGVDLLLGAFSQVASLRPGWDLVIAGIGPEEDQLRAEVPSHLEQRVQWLGFVDRDELPRLYAACDLFVLPSRSEPWAVVVVEALASGLPVIGTDVAGAVVDIVPNFGGGVVVPAEDCEALSSALIEMTEEGTVEPARQHASQALQLWRHDFDPVSGFRSALAHALQDPPDDAPSGRRTAHDG